MTPHHARVLGGLCWHLRVLQDVIDDKVHKAQLPAEAQMVKQRHLQGAATVTQGCHKAATDTAARKGITEGRLEPSKTFSCQHAAHTHICKPANSHTTPTM